MMGGLSAAPAPGADARGKAADLPPTAASDPEASRRGARPGQIGATLMGPGGAGMPGLRLNPTDVPDSVRPAARDTDPDLGPPPTPGLAALSELEPDIGTGGAADHPSGAQAVALMSPTAAATAPQRSHGARVDDDPSDAAITRKAEPLSASAADAVARGEAASGSGDSSTTGRRNFDVESLFEDKLAPEAPPLVGSVASREATEGKVAHDASNGGYVLPRRGVTRTWPLLAAAAVLGLVAIGLSTRACSDDDRVARSGDPASPPAIVAPAPAAKAPEQQQSAAEPSPSVVAANEPVAEPAAPEPATEPAEAKPEPERAVVAKSAATKPKAEPPSVSAAAPTASETRTLTASQARPATGDRVIPYKPGPAVAEVDYKANARALYSSGKYREAAETYQRAAEKSPSDAGAFAGLGASWLSANQPDRAIAAYQRAVQLKPEVSGFQAALGRAYLQKGDRGRAAAAYRKALDLDPQNTAAQAGLKSLGAK